MEFVVKVSEGYKQDIVKSRVFDSIPKVQSWIRENFMFVVVDIPVGVPSMLTAKGSYESFIVEIEKK